ncbi:hypothetical protein BD310DRAFT_937111 [Dichomitus squalens]|uniref:Uncharacterized protein n=1 Tax=Dichomitus squalens TaxID=114155 RepID=A0A4Q9PIM3_9APHY|nr:hypothetical protein BD310DRAFT_937111 [Dichomitus squalens]
MSLRVAGAVVETCCPTFDRFIVRSASKRIPSCAARSTRMQSGEPVVHRPEGAYGKCGRPVAGRETRRSIWLARGSIKRLEPNYPKTLIRPFPRKDKESHFYRPWPF